MRAALRATAILSGSSFLRILVGAVSAKGLALLVGPPGIGVLGLIQSFVSTASLVIGLGVSTVLVRLISDARGRGDGGAVAALWRAATVLTWAMGALGLIGCYVARDALAPIVLGPGAHGSSVVLAGVAVLFTVAYDLEIGLLNAFERIGPLAKASLLSSLASVPVTLGVVAVYGVDGVPWAVVASSAVTWAVSKGSVRRNLTREVVPAGRFRAGLADLVRYGVPYMLSSSSSLGVQRALPIMLISLISVSELGIYRASAILVAQLGFITTAMGQDYYPRVSAASVEALASTIRNQIKIVTLIGSPIVILAQTFSGVAIRVLFSHEFAPAADILRLQLPGFMLMAWSLPFSFAVLGRQSRTDYLRLELSMGVVTVGVFVFFVGRLGLLGTGVAYSVSYLVYVFLAVSIHNMPLAAVVDREVVLHGLLFIASSAAVILLSNGPAVSVPAVVISAVVASVSLVTVWRQSATASS